eukprot:TRINITY_DN1877_c0_g1_i1.p1 TRINITY_DN1877_c0_g1~~TRINITY_DN1877_c0_g1_i1.p1  ORF type:complete len:107 (-),score=25.62 TRINITY_DN1877_c0_g1_i1:156-476(-)
MIKTMNNNQTSIEMKDISNFEFKVPYPVNKKKSGLLLSSCNKRRRMESTSRRVNRPNKTVKREKENISTESKEDLCDINSLKYFKVDHDLQMKMDLIFESLGLTDN